jgi:hypothetical protein
MAEADIPGVECLLFFMLHHLAVVLFVEF